MLFSLLKLYCQQGDFFEGYNQSLHLAFVSFVSFLPFLLGYLARSALLYQCTKVWYHTNINCREKDIAYNAKNTVFGLPFRYQWRYVS